MIIRCDRDRLFTIGGIIILILFALLKLQFLIGARVTTGTVIDTRRWEANGSLRSPNGGFTAPIVSFKADSLTIKFVGEKNLHFGVDPNVPVIYKINEPTDAHIYTLLGFWLAGYAWLIIPFALFGGVVYTVFDLNDRIIINVFKLSIKKDNPS
jgi:hypothetical protein